ncbi:MAG: addiction module toxin RelE [Cyanobacteria bacterium 13_1_40CM_2_61_4]|nr:MAG: addiction module toxin RelE [Cyanobacteria bacterium 13_1_40CM_2_61_4]
MEWDVFYDETFIAELAEIERQTGSSAVREEIAALALLLRRFGPSLRRPHCDTLKGSKHTNMKELRFTLPDGEWRVAFAFDPRRSAILLVAGNKSGTNERRFYRQLIRTADVRFETHLQALQQGKGG